jgi:hypothetical protein
MEASGDSDPDLADSPGLPPDQNVDTRDDAANVNAQVRLPTPVAMQGMATAGTGHEGGRGGGHYIAWCQSLNFTRDVSCVFCRVCRTA